MPDTGAPWNIPYVESTDLVSDWPTDSLALANAIDAGLDAAGSAGIGSNVVFSERTTNLNIASSSYTDTGLSVTITPTAATSKVLLIAACQMLIQYDSADGFWETIITDGSDVEIGNTADMKYGISNATATTNALFNGAVSVVALDSPATTSAVTYKVRAKTSTGTVDVVQVGAGSSLTAIEVAGT